MWRVSSIFGNFRSQYFNCCARNLVCHYSRIATATTTTSSLFQTCFNSLIGKFFYCLCKSIVATFLRSNLSFRLPTIMHIILSTNYFKTTQFIKNKLKLMFMQNITKVQQKHIIYSLTTTDLSLKVS